jgi:hypothetical protein
MPAVASRPVAEKRCSVMRPSAIRSRQPVSPRRILLYAALPGTPHRNGNCYCRRRKTGTRMDLIIGGGTYGSAAATALRRQGRDVIVLDTDPGCRAAGLSGLPCFPAGRLDEALCAGSALVVGGIPAALRIIETAHPERVVPTAPIHIAAALVREKLGFVPWQDGIDRILPALPADLIVCSGGGEVVCSYNRDGTCLPVCTAPAVCPVTRRERSVPLYDLLRSAIPDGIILESVQLGAGLGALAGDAVIALLAAAADRDEMLVGTACRCHGVVTALRRAI